MFNLITNFKRQNCRSEAYLLVGFFTSYWNPSQICKHTKVYANAMTTPGKMKKNIICNEYLQVRKKSIIKTYTHLRELNFQGFLRWGRELGTVMSGKATRANFCVGLPWQNRQNICVGVPRQNRQNFCVGVGNEKIHTDILSILPRYPHTLILSILCLFCCLFCKISTPRHETYEHIV